MCVCVLRNTLFPISKLYTFVDGVLPYLGGSIHPYALFLIHGTSPPPELAVVGHHVVHASVCHISAHPHHASGQRSSYMHQNTACHSIHRGSVRSTETWIRAMKTWTSQCHTNNKMAAPTAQSSQEAPAAAVMLAAWQRSRQTYSCADQAHAHTHSAGSIAYTCTIADNRAPGR